MSHGVKLPMPGEILGPDYRVDCQLHNDGVTAVFGATANGTGKRVALRCFLADDAAEWAEATERFMRCARSANLFQGGKILEIYAVQEDRGRFYAVSEWLEGQTLERYLSEHGPIPVDYALHLLMPCVEALASAHRAGIVHGDVHPSNIFVCNATRTEVERALVQNFGYSKLLAGSELAKQRADANASQWRKHDERPSVQSDIHAFGVTLYRALGGPTPGDARDPSASPRASAAPRAQHIPPAIAVVVARALAVHPSERYTSFEEVASDLAEYKRTRSAPKASRGLSSQATLREIPSVPATRPRPKSEREMLGMTVPGGWSPAPRAKPESQPAVQVQRIQSTECDAVLGVGRSVAITRSPPPPLPVHEVQQVQHLQHIEKRESQQAQQVHHAQPVPRGAALVQPVTFTWIRPASEIAEIDWLAMGDALDQAYSDEKRDQTGFMPRWVARLGLCVALLAWLAVAVELTARMRTQGKPQATRARREHTQPPGVVPPVSGAPLSAAAADASEAVRNSFPPAPPRTAAAPQPSAAARTPLQSDPARHAPTPSREELRPAVDPVRPAPAPKDGQVRGDGQPNKPNKPLDWMNIL